jgi:signal transduction histidine kinase
MLNIISIKYKHYLRNGLAVPFFYKKINKIIRSIDNIIHLMMLGRLANGVLHDIVNPITSLLLSLDTYNYPKSEIEKSSKEISEFIHLIQSQLKNTNTEEEFEISKVINNSCILIKHKAISSNVRIVTAIQDNVIIFGNKILLTRVILNIINNAIESYDRCPSDKNDVVVSVFKDKKFLNISVQDFGCGMTDKDIVKVFKRFYTSKTEGTGIGLYISKRNMKKGFDGDIKIKSKLGSGSTFTIQIPLKITV